MGGATESENRSADDGFFGTTVSWHAVVLLLAVITAGVVSLAVSLPDSMRSAAIDAVYRSNLDIAEQIKTVRGYYTERVVAKVRKNGAMTSSWDHLGSDAAIPLPATLVHEVSDLLARRATTLTLVSPYPWPHRASRLMDEFQVAAWVAFQTAPDRIFSREDVVDGRRVLRVAVADRMNSQTCVDCHNADPLSPRHDWKIGDVRAVLEVSKVTEPYLAAADQRAGTIVGLVAAAATGIAVVIVAFAWIIRRNHRAKERADARVHFLAYRDQMTGLLNRANLMSALDERLADSRRTGERIAVHYIDLDRFKAINDTLGHPTGDAVLVEVARRLRGLAGPGDLVGRLGGDEFVFVQVDLADVAAALRRADEIVEVMNRPVTAGSNQVPISASVGVMSVEVGRADALALIKAADLALYRAKALGRNRHVFYSSDLEIEAADRIRLEKRLRTALADDALALHVQPIFGVVSRRIEVLEVLVRLRDEDGSLVSPARFIPLAEELGLIPEIGATILERACTIAAGWPDGVRLAVNISPLQFGSPEVVGIRLAERVKGALERSGLPPSRLELEITEGCLLADSPLVLEELEAIRALGVGIALDDFGVGYSSLAYLTRVPIDKLKIDGSFVASASGGNRATPPVLEAIVRLARALGLGIVAEGVETAEQLCLSRALGVDQIQGYHCGRPRPIEEVPALLLGDAAKAFERAERGDGAVDCRACLEALSTARPAACG